MKNSHFPQQPGLGIGEYIKNDPGPSQCLFTISNSAGLTAVITNFGARLVSLIVPDRSGKPVDVILGFKKLNHYRQRPESYFGSVVGRYANRINGGEFKINGESFVLDQNENGNCLHGGFIGFDLKWFTVEKFNDTSVTMSLISGNGECGFPGTLTVKVTYAMTENRGLEIAYEAMCDRITVINLTNHAYFNLNGRGNGNILNHIIQIRSDYFIPIDESGIPEGVIQQVDGTPFDLRKALTIGARINDNSLQLRRGKGYNHTFVVRNGSGKTSVVRAMGDKSGIIMEILTTEPGIHFYSGNEMQQTTTNPYGFRSGFALETQHYPDSPNHKNFPSTILKPGQIFKSRTWYKFAV
jgi:aldose 1-epimerase